MITDSVPALEFRNVTKKYYIQQRASPRLGAWVVNKLFEHLRREPFLALNDVSFSVPKGSMVGFLGRNGAGKSTILKLAAGICQPDSGTIHARGRIGSMLELGVGFHQDLSGMENIFYNGIIMGLSKPEIMEKLGKIIAFAGIDPKFLSEPVRHYSSGMYSRLASSVAMHLEPDILLIDEILSVGDTGFQMKGTMRIMELNEKGVTILMVSHGLASLRELCSRLIWIDDGKIREDGDADYLADHYRKFMINETMSPDNFLNPAATIEFEKASESQQPRLVNLKILNGDGEETDCLKTEHPATIEIEYEIPENGPNVVMEIIARWPEGRVLFRDRSPVLTKGTETTRYTIPRWPFLSTAVHLNVGLVDADQPTKFYDRKIDWKLVPSITDLAMTDVDTVMAPATKWTVKKIS